MLWINLCTCLCELLYPCNLILCQSYARVLCWSYWDWEKINITIINRISRRWWKQNAAIDYFIDWFLNILYNFKKVHVGMKDRFSHRCTFCIDDASSSLMKKHLWIPMTVCLFKYQFLSESSEMPSISIFKRAVIPTAVEVMYHREDWHIHLKKGSYPDGSGSDVSSRRLNTIYIYRT